MNILHTKNYLPIDIDITRQPITVKWLDFRKMVLDQPFFVSDAELCFRQDSNVVESSLAELLTISGAVDCVKPKGFIFHMSYCGSTLVCNMLKQLNRNLVYSEPIVPYRVMEIMNDDNQEYLSEVLRGSVEILGRKRLGYEENMVMKFWSGAAYYMPYILKAFPEVPRIYIYRNPIEVLVSNLKYPDQSWFYSPGFVGQTIGQIVEENSPLENCAYALAGKSEAVLKTYDQNCLIVNYDQIGRGFLERLVCHFNMSFTSAEIDKMAKAMEFNAKTKDEKFVPDRSQKQTQASPKVRSVAEKILGPVHERLKHLTVKI